MPQFVCGALFALYCVGGYLSEGATRAADIVCASLFVGIAALASTSSKKVVR